MCKCDLCSTKVIKKQRLQRVKKQNHIVMWVAFSSSFDMLAGFSLLVEIPVWKPFPIWKTLVRGMQGHTLSHVKILA